MAQTQTASTLYSCEGDAVDYTPGSDVYGGDVILIGNVVHISLDDIASGVKGSLRKRGVFKVPKTTAAWTAGLAVYWNPTADPDGGTAGTGAFTQTPTQYLAGYTYIAAASGDDYGYLWLNSSPPAMPLLNTGTVAATGSTQSDAAQIPLGFTLVTAADATKGVLLPTAAAGQMVIIKNAAAAILKIWPATGDGINAVAVNSAFSIAASTSVILVAYDATTWYSIPLVAS